MVNERNTENIVRDILRDNKKDYERGVTIYEQKTDNPLIEKLLKNASKKGDGKGKPEFIITFDDVKDLIIIIECKADTKKHESKNRDKFSEYAVDGVLLYSSYLSKEFNVIAIAVSGEKKSEVEISNFIQINKSNYKEIKSKKILSFKDYVRLIKEDPDKEKLDIDKLMIFSRKLHNDLRDFAKLSEPEKPLLVSAVLIALEDKSFRASYKEETRAVDLATSMISTIEKVLEKAKIPESKRINMLQPYSFIPVHPELTKEKNKDGKNGNILYNLIKEIDENVKKFLENYEHYDVLGQFYGEFLRYAGGDKKGLGIVLTPRHITELFSELANVKKEDIILDNCCGTGGFLISAMKRMIDDAKEDSNEIEKIKKERLIGIEQNPNMFALACANMILRGDGKANIYLGDCFEFVSMIKQKHKCTIGLLNPPYSQKGEGLNELEYVLNCLEGLEKNSIGVAIVPMSCVLQDSEARKRLLKAHSILAIMSMPDKLFYPVGTVTCIMVLKANNSHDFDNEVWFGLWKNDGFVKAKNEGRIDKNKEFENIKKEWIDMFKNKKIIPNKSISCKITPSSEWCAEEYLDTDYSELKDSDFKKTLLDYLSYCIFKEDLSVIKNFTNIKGAIQLNINKFKKIKLSKLFSPILGKPIHKNKIKIFSERYNQKYIPYVTRTAGNNGVELFIDKAPFNDKTQKGNCISIGAEGFMAFYQKDEFITGNKVNILYNDNLNEFNAIFLNTILDLEIKHKFNYGRGLVKSRLSRISLKLPVDINGEPDWKFMENYIKSII